MTRERRIQPIDLALAMGLYALQGVVVAYLVNYNKKYMIASGVSMSTAGLVETAVLLTLVFKFVLGPISDRFSPFGLGHRRPFIVLGLLTQSLGLVGLSAIHPGTQLAGYAAMAFLVVVGLSLYDTCCDGLIVDVTPAEDRARVQGLVQVARFVATMGFTLGFGLWLDKPDVGPSRIHGVLWTCAALGLPVLVLALFAHEPVRERAGEAFDWSALRVIGRPDAIALFAFGALYGMIGLGVEFNLSGYYSELGYGPADVGIFGAIRYGGRAAGALLLPAMKGRIDRRGELTVGIVALAVTTAGQAAAVGRLLTGTWAFVFGMANGWNDALFCVLAMEAADPRMAASTFAIFMAVSNLSVLGNALFLEAVVGLGRGYRPVFVITAALGLGLLGLVPSLSRIRSKGPVVDVTT
jgi:PAT family beta-lactamase induction signal transducer AmpG